VAIGLVALFEDRRALGDLEAVRKAGYPVTWQELNQWYETVPTNANAALKILRAIESFRAPTPSQQLILDQPLLPGVALTTNRKATIRDVLTNNLEALQLVQEAAALEKSRYPIDLSQGANAMLPHLAGVKNLVGHLKLFSIFWSGEGEMAGAFQSYTNALAVSLTLSREPTLISQLVRIACVAIAQSAFERLVSRHQLSDADLQFLEKCLQNAEAAGVQGMKRGLAGERALCLRGFQMSPGQLAALFGTTNTPLSNLVFGARKITGCSQRDYVLFRRVMEGWIESADLPFPANLEKGRSIRQEFQSATRGFRQHVYPLSAMLLPAFDRALLKEARIAALLRLGQVAAGIERYLLVHNNAPPDGLDQLVPAFLPRIPKDPFDGQPIRYSKSLTGYVLHSIGEDGKDDQGKAQADVVLRVEK
jgi:hypothetical protein